MSCVNLSRWNSCAHVFQPLASFYCPLLLFNVAYCSISFVASLERKYKKCCEDAGAGLAVPFKDTRSNLNDPHIGQRGSSGSSVTVVTFLCAKRTGNWISRAVFRAHHMGTVCKAASTIQFVVPKFGMYGANLHSPLFYNGVAPD